MFGFIRPVKSELRVREVDRFQQVYCGLCHAIRARYGRFYTLFLSYDMTFFALIMGAQQEETPPPCRARCDASPVKRRDYASEDDALALAADVSVLLAYHKLCDTVHDERGAKRLAAQLLRRIGGKGYERARARQGAADQKMVQALGELQELERERCDSMDRAADASARLTAAAVPETGDARQRILEQLFYHVGRWIYLLDACADLEEDMQSGGYNPVALRYVLQTPSLDEVREPLEKTLERSLVDVCTAFDLLCAQRDEELIRNIIFLGMPVVTKQVLDGTYRPNGGRANHGSL